MKLELSWNNAAIADLIIVQIKTKNTVFKMAI